MRNSKFQISLLVVSAILSNIWQGCSNQDADMPDAERMALLSLRLNLNETASADGHNLPTRVGEEYEPDKLPLNDNEKMNSVRIIIADENGVVEHNRLIRLDNPDVATQEEKFSVRPNSTKQVILIANEDGATISLPGSHAFSATSYFSKFSGSAGTYINMEEIRNLLFESNANTSTINDGCIKTPLVMSALHTVYIGGPDKNYSKTLTIHRAAVKYTYRITNNDQNHPHTIDWIKISEVASLQYLFPNADFTDESQYFWNSYETPSDANRKQYSYDTPVVIPAKGTVEIGPLYFVEGHPLSDGDCYKTSFSFDGNPTVWCPLEWSIPQTPETTYPMTDLPRNTHVIVNVAISYNEFSINYTVCPWNDFSIDIPDFN